MKITLNDSIPAALRPEIEKLVKSFSKSAEIAWLPSRFPHLVMFVDPGPPDQNELEKSSIFEAPSASKQSTASLTALLEERIKACIAKHRS